MSRSAKKRALLQRMTIFAAAEFVRKRNTNTCPQFVIITVMVTFSCFLSSLHHQHPPPLAMPTSFLCRLDRIRIVKRANGYDNVHEHTQRALEPITLAVAQEVAHDNNGEDQHDGFKRAELQVHVDATSPADEDDERRVEQGGLDTRTEHVDEGEVGLVVVGLVERRDVFCRLLDQRDEDKAHEGVGNVRFVDYVFDFVDQENGDEGDAGEGED